MRIDISGLSFKLTEAIVEHVTRRVESATAPLTALAIEGAMVRLWDTNGPRGGVDKACRIVVWMRGRKPVVVDAIDQDLYAAIDAAAAKLKETMLRQQRRERTLLREHANHRLRRLIA